MNELMRRLLFLPDQASTFATSVDHLHYFVITVTMIASVATGRLDRADNPLKHAPHTAREIMADVWTHAYSREQAAFPLPWVAASKYWPPVKRVDNVYGDRNLVCTCAPLEAFAQAAE